MLAVISEACWDEIPTLALLAVILLAWVVVIPTLLLLADIADACPALIVVGVFDMSVE